MKIQIVPPKKTAPPYVPYICAGMYVAIAIFAVLVILKRNIFLAIPIPLIILVLFLISRHFSWYIKAELKTFGDTLVYTVVLPMSALGHDKSVYTIKNISSLKKKSNVLIVYGSIVDKEPLQKSKNVKKVEIYDYNDEVMKLVNEFMSK